MPLLTRKRVLAAKIETAVGTAEDLTASEAAFNVFDLSPNPNINFTQRKGQQSFSTLPAVPEGEQGQVTFAVEAHGSGVAEEGGGESVPDWAKAFLPACGMVLSTDEFGVDSAAPTGGSDATAVRTLTLGFYEDGLKKALKGCMGNAVFSFNSGQVIRIEFTFTGVWVAPSDVGLLSPTYPTVTPARFVSSGLTIGAWSPKVQELTIDLGNDVQMREDSDQAEGYVSAIIADRNPTGTLNPEATLVATNDAYGDWLSSTEQALSISVTGGGDGNTLAFAAPKLQFQNVQEGDRNGIQTDDITFQLNRSAATGDDEFTLTFS